MPILSRGRLNIDFDDEGAGRPAVLVHSSVSGNRQWKALAVALKDAYRVLSINLFGYGQTSPWDAASPQTISAQADLVLALSERIEGPIQLVGHSLGALVALDAAAILGSRVNRLVLFEPNPFALLKQYGCVESYEEVLSLQDRIKHDAMLGEWLLAAERVADYWSGDGFWATLPDEWRANLAASLPPNLHEWDAVMDERMNLERWRAIPARTLLVWARDTRPPLRDLVAIFSQHCPHWEFQELATGGHMAPLTRPRPVNALIRRFLDREND